MCRALLSDLWVSRAGVPVWGWKWGRKTSRPMVRTLMRSRLKGRENVKCDNSLDAINGVHQIIKGKGRETLFQDDWIPVAVS